MPASLVKPLGLRTGLVKRLFYLTGALLFAVVPLIGAVQLFSSPVPLWPLPDVPGEETAGALLLFCGSLLVIYFLWLAAERRPSLKPDN